MPRGRRPFAILASFSATATLQVTLSDRVRIHPGPGFLRETVRGQADHHRIRSTLEGRPQERLVTRMEDVEGSAEDDAHSSTHPVRAI